MGLHHHRRATFGRPRDAMKSVVSKKEYKLLRKTAASDII